MLLYNVNARRQGAPLTLMASIFISGFGGRFGAGQEAKIHVFFTLWLLGIFVTGIIHCFWKFYEQDITRAQALEYQA